MVSVAAAEHASGSTAHAAVRALLPRPEASGVATLTFNARCWRLASSSQSMCVTEGSYSAAAMRGRAAEASELRRSAR